MFEPQINDCDVATAMFFLFLLMFITYYIFVVIFKGVLTLLTQTCSSI